MPCGGIYAFTGTPYPCWVCGEATAELFCEEWDTTLHVKCLGAFLQSSEGRCVLLHKHAIEIPEGLEAEALPIVDESVMGAARNTLGELALIVEAIKALCAHNDELKTDLLDFVHSRPPPLTHKLEPKT